MGSDDQLDTAATAVHQVALPTRSAGAHPQDEPGTTWISDAIVAKVAAAAAGEVPGVQRVVSPAGWWARAFGCAREVEVAVDGALTTIDLGLVVADQVSIPDTVEAVRARVTERVEFTTGLRVRQVNVRVLDLAPRASASDRKEAPDGPRGEPT